MLRNDTNQVFVLEFTRPFDKSIEALQRANRRKKVKYKRLLQRLTNALPTGWSAAILTFAVGVR